MQSKFRTDMLKLDCAAACDLHGIYICCELNSILCSPFAFSFAFSEWNSTGYTLNTAQLTGMEAAIVNFRTNSNALRKKIPDVVTLQSLDIFDKLCAM